ncbi:MAG: hypothetical protein ACRENU_12370 [Gemmatimonadaceae bacterium]
MAEVLINFTEPVKAKHGDLYYGRVLGQPMDDGILWEGWVEFTLAGAEESVSTRRETEQRNRADLIYWAKGLTVAYLEGALERALSPAPRTLPAEPRVFVEAAPKPAPLRAPVVPKRIVLDPFQTFVQGEDLLRSQLFALSHDDVQNIVEAYRFSTDDARRLRTAPIAELVECVVSGVRARYEATNSSAAGTEPVAEADQPSARAEDRPA